MRTYDNGTGFTVSFTADEVKRFRSRWPCSGFRLQPGWFAFENNGDLVDVAFPGHEAADGGAVVAFSQNCYEYGQSRIRALRARHARKLTKGPVTP